MWHMLQDSHIDNQIPRPWIHVESGDSTDFEKVDMVLKLSLSFLWRGRLLEDQKAHIAHPRGHNERCTDNNELIQLMFHVTINNSESCTGILGQTVAQKDEREQLYYS